MTAATATDVPAERETLKNALKVPTVHIYPTTTLRRVSDGFGGENGTRRVSTAQSSFAQARVPMKTSPPLYISPWKANRRVRVCGSSLRGEM